MHRYFMLLILFLNAHRTECNGILQDIIKKQIEQHANYELKTEYSKDKYKKRKEAKSVERS